MDTQERLHALDALRAFALFLGIYFHASLSYLPSFEEWVVSDTSSSFLITIVSGFSHLFRMALFFFIAGYFARLVYHRKGRAYFIRDRAKRIALPLLIFLPIMLPLLGVIWWWGAQHKGITLDPPPPLTVDNFPLTHLWFLYYLLWMYAFAIAARELFANVIDRSQRIRGRLDRWLEALLRYRVGPIVFALPFAFAALMLPEWNPATGINSPDRSLIPQLVPTIGFGTSFAVGWWCQRSSATLAILAQRTTSSLLVSLVFLGLTFACGPAVHQAIGTPAWPWLQFAAAICVALTFWYFNFFLVGIALKHLNRPSPAARYAADSSYWLYIAHLPLVTALQVVAAKVHWHWTIELSLIVIVSIGVLLLSYHLIVRSTWLGAILNGKRLPRRPTTSQLVGATS